MAIKNGTFVISLDYEIHWGVFDAMTLDNYGENLKNVDVVIERLLLLCEKYDVKLTFATVGMLFAKNKADLQKFSPKNKPSYNDNNLDPFRLIHSIGDSENDDKLHYAVSMINKLKNSIHEVGTHTYSHYNCLAKGQTIDQFEEDVIAAKKIANNLDIDVESIVFPKNQVNKPYLDICEKHGILSYRGTENNGIYNGRGLKGIMKNVKMVRLKRLLDGYFNLTGYNTYNVDEINKKNTIINLPSSRFLRPYLKNLSLFEFLKVRRIKNAMKHAAKNNEMFHLWWHPHNFGAQIDQNFKNLERIFIAYKELNLKYQFESITMTELTKKIKN